MDLLAGDCQFRESGGFGTVQESENRATRTRSQDVGIVERWS